MLDFNRCTRADLARALADSLVVYVDALAETSSCIYRSLAEHWLDDVAAAVAELEHEGLRNACDQLMKCPDGVKEYSRLVSLVEAVEVDHTISRLLERAWTCEQNTRISYELGSLYDSSESPCSMEQLVHKAAPNRAISKRDADVLVVMPFRDGERQQMRIRNLLACIMALQDQSLSRDRYQLVVVETDSEPRWQDTIRPLVDNYIFARNAGKFNKSWAVNVGVAHAEDPFRLICILDADVLCDRDFLTRNISRFNSFGCGGLLPYRNMSCLDPVSTSVAIRSRCLNRRADVVPARLRSFTLRRPPGACMWVRADVFHRIHGMDERFEGWGGEDDDLKYRIDMAAPLDFYNDRLWHMYHPSSGQLVNGRIVNVDTIPPMSWAPTGPIGDLSRFVEVETKSR